MKDYEAFERQMDNALDNHEELGKKARAYVETELGATDKIYNDLFAHL